MTCDGCSFVHVVCLHVSGEPVVTLSTLGARTSHFHGLKKALRLENCEQLLTVS